MPALIDSSAIRAIFETPEIDGSFQGAVLDYLRQTGTGRPLLLLAFAPKAAGTFFRAAATLVVKGRLVRLVHAQGGRDAQLYLPYLLACLLDPNAPPTIGHVHMQAFAASRNLITALGLKPIIMLRDVADMLASFLDMLEVDPAARAEGLNCQVPENFTQLARDTRLDFMIEMIAPWYASYFATWKDFADQDANAVCVLTYRDFCDKPAVVLHAALTHAGFSVSQAECDSAIIEVWGERGLFRFNQGKAGRSEHYFSPDHFARLRKLLALYPQLEPWLPMLLEKDADAPDERTASPHTGRNVYGPLS
jgi:hypothetical protein